MRRMSGADAVRRDEGENRFGADCAEGWFVETARGRTQCQPGAGIVGRTNNLVWSNDEPLQQDAANESPFSARQQACELAWPVPGQHTPQVVTKLCIAITSASRSKAHRMERL